MNESNLQLARWVLIENARKSADMAEREVACCVRGYHVYKTIWGAAVGEVLICRREPTNSADRYAVAVLKEQTIIGHLHHGRCRKFVLCS